MFYTSIDNVNINRTLKPLYAKTQATPQGWTWDTSWNTATADVFPASVVYNKGNGEVSLCLDATTHKPMGLCGNFIAPVYGVNEIQGVGSVTVWVMGPDAMFEVYSPAFDTSASWITAEPDVALCANSVGKLTIAESGDYPIARLIQVFPDYIIIAGLGESTQYHTKSALKVLSAISLKLPSEAVVACTITECTGAVTVEVPAATVVTSLIVESYTISPAAVLTQGATAVTAGTSHFNFTSPVAFTATAEDATTKTYTVTVTFAS